MKIVLLALALGILEVVTIGKVHEAIETKGLVLVYLGSTILGLVLAWIYYSDFKVKKGNLRLSKKMGNRIKEGTFSLKDQESLRRAAYLAYYIFACVLIGIPGILTDILGITLIFPAIRKWIVHRVKFGEAKGHV